MNSAKQLGDTLKDAAMAASRKAKDIATRVARKAEDAASAVGRKAADAGDALTRKLDKQIVRQPGRGFPVPAVVRLHWRAWAACR